MKCPACKARNLSSSRFCKKCGQPLVAGPTAADPGEACSVCKTRNPAGAKFCKKCGQSLEASPPSLPEPPVAPEPAPTPVFRSKPERGAPALVESVVAPARQAPADPGEACSVCKARNPAGAKFCKQCGQSLEVSPPPKPPAAPEPEPTPVFRSKPEPEPAPEPGSPAPVETVEPEKPVPAALAVGLAERLQRARHDPAVLLEQAHGRFNFLEVLGVVIVGALFGLLYVAGWLKWGPSMMLRSGAPVFLAYVLGLLVGLKSLRSLLDKPLRPAFDWLGRFSPRMRVLVALVFPLVFAFYFSKDRNMGFQSAAFTVTVTTLLSHVLVRSTAFSRRAS